MKKYFFLFLLLLAGIPFFSFAANEQTFSGTRINVGGYIIILDGSADSMVVATSSFNITISSSTTVTLTSNDKINLDNTLGLTTNCGANSSTLTITRSSADSQVTATITPGSACPSGGSGGGGGGGASSPAPSPAPAPPPPPPPPPPPSISTTSIVWVAPIISGKISDANGNGVSGILVDATLSGGSGYVTTSTTPAGEYFLALSEGTWDINARPTTASGYYNPDTSIGLTLKNGDNVLLNFTLRLAESVISGRLVDESGNAISDASGFVILQKNDSSINFGAQIVNGSFTFRAPAGSYLLTVFLPDDSLYSAGASRMVSTSEGQTLSVSMQVTRKNSFIIGSLKDESGAVLTGISARVFASTKEGVWQEIIVDLLTGKYSLKVSAGTWYLGYSVDSLTGYVVPEQQGLVLTVGVGATVAQDLVIKKAASVITGQVIDPLNKGVAGVFVSVNKISSTATDTAVLKNVFVAGAQTDSEGFYKIFVPAGAYYLRTFLKPGFTYANTEEKYVVADVGKTATFNFQLRVFQLKLNGAVVLSTTTVGQAFVSAWSEKGAYQETQSLADGSYSLSVNVGDIWRVSASKEINGVFYKSSESSVIIGIADALQNLALEKVVEISPPTISTVSADKPAMVSIAKGPSVFAPAGSIAGGGALSIIINPDTRTPAQAGIKVVGIAYNFEARNSTGTIIQNFRENITISIPYNETDLKIIGALEDNLVLSFWDEGVGAWREVSDSLVNKAENFVTGVINHFTRFAIVAPADTTPPAPPSSVSASPVSGGKVLLSWKNPLRDFHHIKIYRSEAKGVFGQIIKNDISGQESQDSGLTGGKIYYYLVRSIDPAGNESKNIEQVSLATAAGTVIAQGQEKISPGISLKLSILRNLSVNSEGGDVKSLQEFLLKEGVYPGGLITGFFGNLTKQAVIRFQEKYAYEILKPAGLVSGTGVVGPGTMKKINALLSGSILAVEPLSESSPVKLKISKNLSMGDFGNEVKSLQELLVKEGVYPEAKITGYFGFFTKKAVIRFQEKYREVILEPSGLVNGSGFVGALTRKKINELIAK